MHLNFTSTFSAAKGRQRCAILIHGTPRSFLSIVLPTLERNVIKPNARYNCDYFVQFHVQNYDEVPSYPGRSGFVYSNDTYQLEQVVLTAAHDVNSAYNPTIRFVTSTNEEVFNRHEVFLLKTHLLKDKGGNWLYFPDKIRSWDGLQLAWDLLETRQTEKGVNYDHVVVLHSDVAYPTPIDIYGEVERKKSLTISDAPTKHLRDSTMEGRYRKRIVYGSNDAVKIWSTGRITQLDSFVNWLANEEFGTEEDVFLSDFVLPLLKEAGVSVQYDSTICTLDAFPDESVSLVGCGDDSITTKQDLEAAMGLQCVASYHFDDVKKSQPTSCSWKTDKLISTIGSIKRERNTAAICLIVSNEEMYLDEWMDYHLGLGFSHIYIYDNTDSSDLGHGWLERRPRLDNKVTVTSYKGQNKQGSSYQHCAQNYLINRHRWVGFFDADEYLVLKKHSNVVSFLLEYCTRGAISLSWQLHSWNDRLQYSPDPVTKRFQGMHGIDQHVKTISSVDAINLTATHHPHYAFLKEGYTQLDTNGNEISPRWQNLRFPSDVGVFFHHHCKSWKEYVAKRMRGRATMSGNALEASRKELVQKAKNKDGFKNSTRIDPLAWTKLKSVSIKYEVFESSSLHFRQSSNHTSSKKSTAICSVVCDQEAYVDEWIDYHLALGVSAVYVLDSSEDFWMRQWGEERGQTAPIVVTHFPGNVTNPSYKAKAYAKCLALHRHDHQAMVFFDVNDFLVFPDGKGLSSVDHLVSSTSSCAFQIQRVVFGNSGQFVFDPLPVAKRFMFRVESKRELIHPALILHVGAERMGNDSLGMLEYEISEYLVSGAWKSEICTGHTSVPNNIAAYHYLRSVKECMKDRGDEQLCNLKGTVEDQFAWMQMQRLMPDYSNFNGFL
eukprot:g3426.t1.1.5e174189 g3426  g3426.t1 contig12:2045619-2048359(-)